MKQFNYLVTSGCSFSDNMGKKWPHHLATGIQAKLYNMGEQSAGNGWISRSAIFKADQLIKSGIPVEEILMVVMWSGLDRRGFFISREETANYVNLSKDKQEPRSFINPDPILTAYHVGKDRGWLEGANMMTYNSFTQIDPRVDYRNDAFQFFPTEALAIESYEHFLRLQWYCKSHNITLINLTYGDIMRYPNSSFINPRKKNRLTKDTFIDVAHLYDMVDFSNWIFFEETSGMFEYVFCNNLGFTEDGVHPGQMAHRRYAEDFLIPNLKERKVI